MFERESVYVCERGCQTVCEREGAYERESASMKESENEEESKYARERQHAKKREIDAIQGLASATGSFLYLFWETVTPQPLTITPQTLISHPKP